MIRIAFLFLLGWICFFNGMHATAQSLKPFNTTTLVAESDTNHLSGTLVFPAEERPHPLVLLIAGSGHTDRDGNQPNHQADSYKKLAEALVQYNIASLRYDKRGVGESSQVNDEAALRFDDYIDDAVHWIQMLKKDEHVSAVYVAGHSEGSLIGMIACQRIKANGFISIAGPGRPVDDLLKSQLKAVVPDSAYFAKCSHYLDTLHAGHRIEHPDSILYAIFRPSIQPYLINWMQYDPAKEIGKLHIPVLVLQGDNDLQIDVSNANLLAGGNKKAKLHIIEGMNHVLKKVDADRAKNMASYSDPSLPVADELVKEIAQAIQQ